LSAFVYNLSIKGKILLSVKEKCSFFIYFFYFLRITTNFIIVVLHWHNTIGKYRWYWIIGYTKNLNLISIIYPFAEYLLSSFDYLLESTKGFNEYLIATHANNTSSIPSTFSIHINKNWYTIWNVLSYTGSSIPTIIYICQCVSSLWYRYR
jgi:hypothetical protein